MCKMDPVSLAVLRAKNLAAQGHTQGTDLDIPDEVRELLPVGTPRSDAYGTQPLPDSLQAPNLTPEQNDDLMDVLTGWGETSTAIERDLVEATEERQPDIRDELRTRARIRRSIPRHEPDRIADLCERAADTIDNLLDRIAEAELDALDTVNIVDETEVKRNVVVRQRAYSVPKDVADELDSRQAKIDSLMMEFTPEDMTVGQVAEWARNQRPVSFSEVVSNAFTLRTGGE